LYRIFYPEGQEVDQAIQTGKAPHLTVCFTDNSSFSEAVNRMNGFRYRMVLLLVAYFAGFATAIYALAPAPAGENETTVETTFAGSFLKSDRFALSFNDGMRRYLSMARQASSAAADYIRTKLPKKPADSPAA